MGECGGNLQIIGLKTYSFFSLRMLPSAPSSEDAVSNLYVCVTGKKGMCNFEHTIRAAYIFFIIFFSSLFQAKSMKR